MCNHKRILVAVIVIFAGFGRICSAESKRSAAMDSGYRNNESTIIRDVTVIDYKGNRVKGAQVFVLCGQPDYAGRTPSHPTLAEASTNGLGQARLQWPHSEDDHFVIAYKPGLSVGWSLTRNWNPRQKIFLQLGEVAALSGMVVDEDGRPVAGANVEINPQSSSEFNFSAFGWTMVCRF